MTSLIGTLNGFFWGPAMLILIGGAGIFFTLYLKAF